MKVTLEGRVGWIAFTALIVAMLLFAWFADEIVGAVRTGWQGAQLAWVVGLVLVSIGVLVAGKAINGRWSGAFIDSRNRYSLSQVQTVAWVALVSSGIVAMGISNVRHAVATPLDLAIPVELLAVMGLSVTTLVGTPLIRSVKRDNTADVAQTTRTLNNLGMQTTTEGPQVFGVAAAPAGGAAAFSLPAGGGSAVVARNEGTIVTLEAPTLTGWADLLRGEETGNADKIDLGKLQLLYVTTVAIVVYAALMFTTLGSVADDGKAVLLAFPALDDSFVGILALSHVGGLAYQAAPHAKTTP